MADAMHRALHAARMLPKVGHIYYVATHSRTPDVRVASPDLREALQLCSDELGSVHGMRWRQTIAMCAAEACEQPDTDYTTWHPVKIAWRARCRNAYCDWMAERLTGLDADRAAEDHSSPEHLTYVMACDQSTGIEWSWPVGVERLQLDYWSQDRGFRSDLD